MNRRRSWLNLVAAIAALLPAAAARGQGIPAGRQYTEIAGTGESLYNIAVASPLAASGTESDARLLQQVLSRDLQLIGLFRVLDPRGFLANLSAEGTRIQPQSWLQIGAQGVVKARISRSGSGLRVEWYLYEVSRSRTPVVSRSYSGTNVRQLAHRFGNDVVAYFTRIPGPFLSHIAFVSANPRRKTSQIFVIDFDGHGPHQVSRTGKQNLLPTWSPRGALAYTSLYWHNPDLYVLPAGGGRARRVSRYPGLNSAGSWSPDGHHIALTLSKDGNAELYTITPDGKHPHRLTYGAGIDTSPTWSPDGGRIAFVSDRAGSPQIYVMSSRGGAARRLTFAGNYNQEPNWCPRKDQPLVAFTGRDERGSYDIYTVNVDNGAIKRLTQGQGSNKSPSWSPDGRLIVFASSRGGLWVMTPEGLNQQQIYRGRASTPAWSQH